MDENEKKNLNGSIKSFIGDRLSKAKEKDVKEKSGDSVSSGTGIDRSNIRQPKAGFGKTESSSSTGTEVKEDGGELSAEEVRKAREKAETERIKAEKEAEKKLKAEKAREEKVKREEEKKKRQEEKQEAAKLKKEEAQKKKEEALRKKEEAAAAAAAAGASAGAAAGASEKAEGKENIWKEKFSEFKRSIKENDFEGTDIEEEDEFEHVPMDDDKRKTRGRVKLFVTLGAAAAIAIIAIVFSLRNNSYGYIFNQGVNQFNNEEYDDAVATFEKLYELEPGKKDTELMRYLAESYVKKNRYKEALEIYNKALETDPNYGPAVTGLCAMYTQMKDGKALNETLEKYRGTNLESFTDEYKVAMPESDPKPGTYDEDFEVRFSGTSGIPIFYTTDGSEPTAQSRIYTTPIKVSEGTSNIKAISINNLGIKSGILDGKYTVTYRVPNEPVIHLNSGIYITGQTVDITTDENTTVYYTTDGSTPTGSSNRYDGTLRLVRGNVILSAIAISNHGKQSAVATKNYIIVKDGKELEDVEKSNTPTTAAPAATQSADDNRETQTQTTESALSQEGSLTPEQSEALEGARLEAEEEAQSNQ